MLILLGKYCLWIWSKFDPIMIKYKNIRIHIKNENWKKYSYQNKFVCIQTNWDAVFVNLSWTIAACQSYLCSLHISKRNKVSRISTCACCDIANFLEGKYNFLIWVLEPLAKWIALVRSGCSGALLVFFNWEIIGQNVEINVKQYVRVSFLILSGCYEKFLALTLAALAN